MFFHGQRNMEISYRWTEANLGPTAWRREVQDCFLPLQQGKGTCELCQRANMRPTVRYMHDSPRTAIFTRSTAIYGYFLRARDTTRSETMLTWPLQSSSTRAHSFDISYLCSLIRLVFLPLLYRLLLDHDRPRLVVWQVMSPSALWIQSLINVVDGLSVSIICWWTMTQYTFMNTTIWLRTAIDCSGCWAFCDT